MVVNVPKHIWQKDDECRESAQPHPFVEQKPALGSEDQTDDDGETENQDRVLFFETNSSDHSEPEPVFWLIALDGQDGEVDTAHPEQHFQIAIAGQQTAA